MYENLLVVFISWQFADRCSEQPFIFELNILENFDPSDTNIPCFQVYNLNKGK